MNSIFVRSPKNNGLYLVLSPIITPPDCYSFYYLTIFDISKIKRAHCFFFSLALYRVGIYHCCSYIAVPQKFLNRTNIIISLQEMACKAVPKGMGRGPFAYFGLVDSSFDSLLNMAFMKMVAPVFIGFWYKG